jgi:hypothetical protein
MALGVIDPFKHIGVQEYLRFPLAASWANVRTWRLADGPDEVPRAKNAKLGLLQKDVNPIFLQN